LQSYFFLFEFVDEGLERRYVRGTFWIVIMTVPLEIAMGWGITNENSSLDSLLGPILHEAEFDSACNVLRSVDFWLLALGIKSFQKLDCLVNILNEWEFHKSEDVANISEANY
jgi:hypothetical protein